MKTVPRKTGHVPQDTSRRREGCCWAGLGAGGPGTVAKYHTRGGTRGMTRGMTRVLSMGKTRGRTRGRIEARLVV